MRHGLLPLERIFMKKQDQWLKRRHAVVRNIIYLPVYLIAKLKYGATVKKFTEQKGRAYLVLLNHQTPFDQFFVGLSFTGAIYYLATEDIFSKGWISSLIRWLIAPIPIRKQTTDIAAIKTCIRVAREGGTICIAPEGNRTYSGKTEYMSSAIGSMAKKLKLPIALYRIEGGYGIQPRWSDVIRKGKMTAEVSRVIEPEEYEDLTAEELFALIKEGLYVNEAKADGAFGHKNRAEYLERAIYVCPFCGLSVFESRGAVIECLHCHRRVEYQPTKELIGVGFDFPFRFVNDWYEYQKDFVRQLDLTKYTDIPLYTDGAQLFEVIIKKRKKLLCKQAEIKLYGDRIAVDEGGKAPMILRFEEISVIAVLGRNKLNIYYGDKVYQLKGGKRFNGLKYVNIFYHHKNIEKGDGYGEFLGL